VTLRSTFTRIATLALAAAALAAPTASARPVDMPPAVAQAAAAEQYEQPARAAEADGFPTRSSQPDATRQTPADPGTNWATIAIGIAGGLLAVGAIALVAGRTRRTARARIAA
jgi:hypothetical protein